VHRNLTAPLAEVIPQRSGARELREATLRMFKSVEREANGR
jgi:hypothetical protein